VLNILKKPESIFIIILLILSIVLLMLPNEFSDKKNESIRAKAKVISVDNSQLEQRGIIKTGVQSVRVKILDGPFKGTEFTSPNNLRGQLEIDKMFAVNDIALVVIDKVGNKLSFVNIIDHYRLNLELVLIFIFIALLIGFAGWTGVKSVISFVFTILMIWKVLIPLFLKGWNPIIVSLLVVTILVAVTTFLVAGLNRRALVSFLGSISGVIITCVFALLFGISFKIHGAVVSFSESLLYSGYGNLNLTYIFISGIFIASSGAIMDVTMDIATAVYEVVINNPKISKKEAIKSGFSVARAVIGTMTTTLLLAYSGGYMGMLMVFIAQGTPVINILNLTYVSAEILHTIVGSFGLILVAPLTSVLSGLLFTEKEYIKKIVAEDFHVSCIEL
jgi:uncharacterized membrane protein